MRKKNVYFRMRTITYVVIESILRQRVIPTLLNPTLSSTR